MKWLATSRFLWLMQGQPSTRTSAQQQAWTPMTVQLRMHSGGSRNLPSNLSRHLRSHYRLLLRKLLWFVPGPCKPAHLTSPPADKAPSPENKGPARLNSQSSSPGPSASDVVAPGSTERRESAQSLLATGGPRSRVCGDRTQMI